MKVLVDENLSPALARSLHALFAGEHEIIHIRERFGPNVKDIDWIGQMSADGRWIVISGDRRGRYERRVERFCSDDRALDKAERMGVRRARIETSGRRIVEVRGRTRDGRRIVVSFSRAPSCPVIR